MTNGSLVVYYIVIYIVRGFLAIVIRVAYNNKGWKDACDTPGKDDYCWCCFSGILQITPPKKDDIVCSGNCWERRLCIDYRWGCTPKGRVYGIDAYHGVSVFLVFKQPDGNYTIWGKTTVSAVDSEPMNSDKNFENGFAFIHFNPFEPLPRDKWLKDISDVKLVGARWLQGRHRYIDSNQEKYLSLLLEGKTTEAVKPILIYSDEKDSEGIVISTKIMPHIYKRLEDISSDEGRSIDELVREAIAGWITKK